MRHTYYVSWFHTLNGEVVFRSTPQVFTNKRKAMQAMRQGMLVSALMPSLSLSGTVETNQLRVDDPQGLILVEKVQKF